MQSLLSLIGKVINPPPLQLADFYGFRWQPNQAVPAAFQGFNAATTAPGIYIGFRPALLDPDAPTFGDGVNRVLLYPLPAAGSQGLINITNTALQLAPQDLGLYVNPLFLRQLQGYMAYTNSCLNYIALTAVGQQLLNRLNAPGRFPIYINPAAAGNSVQVANSNNSLNQIAFQMTQQFNNLNFVQMTDLVVSAYPAGNFLAKMTQLATDLNAMPLYSLFIDEAAPYPPNFLQQLQFNAGAGLAPITGNLLQEWLLQANAPFTNFLQNDATLVNNVRLINYFRIALIIKLYSVSLSGGGTGSTLAFNVKRDVNDPHDLNTNRPPAIGLAHELIHALHNAEGTQPGLQINDYSTVLAELLCVGLGPFNAVPISENAIRAQWAAIAAQTDVSNNIAAPRRTIYDDPVQSGLTVDAIRLVAHTY